MLTVLRFDGFSVVIYPADHRPSHVHVFGGGKAIFNLNCPDGPVALRENYGFARPQSPGFARRSIRKSPGCARNGAEFMARPDEFAQATRRAMARRSTEPAAIAARYDRRRDRIVVSLNNGLELAFPPRLAQGLESATSAELADIEISPSGFGIHFPKVDAQLYLPALLQGVFGSKRWMAAQLGAAGGIARSAAKAAAARVNGRRGGRPRKIVAGQR